MGRKPSPRDAARYRPATLRLDYLIEQAHFVTFEAPGGAVAEYSRNEFRDLLEMYVREHLDDRAEGIAPSLRDALLRNLRARFLENAPPALISRIAVWRLLGGRDDDLPRLLGGDRGREGSGRPPERGE